MQQEALPHLSVCNTIPPAWMLGFSPLSARLNPPLPLVLGFSITREAFPDRSLGVRPLAWLQQHLQLSYCSTQTLASSLACLLC